MVNPVQKTIFACEGCSTEYLKEQTAARHEKKCLQEQKEKRALANFHSAKHRLLSNAKSLDELFNGLKELSEKAFDVKFTIFKVNLEYSNTVSNSHGCPVGGVTNWHVNTSEPLGYPGFTGTFNYRIESSPDGCGRFGIRHITRDGESYNKPSLHHGTGGAGPNSGSYSLYFFMSDFPDLKMDLNRMKLKGVDLHTQKFVNDYAKNHTMEFPM